MTSKFKDQTGNTPPLSSADGTVGKVPPSEPLARTDNTPISTPITKPPLQGTLPEGRDAFDNTLTTPKVTEKARQHAILGKVALTQLEKAGLIRRFKVLSDDGTTLQKIRIEFDMSIWTDELELK